LNFIKKPVRAQRTSIENSFRITIDAGEPWTMDSSMIHVEFGSLLTTEKQERQKAIAVSSIIYYSNGFILVFILK